MAIDHDTLLRTLLAERAKMLAYIRALVRRRETAEDVFQDVCVIALEKREQIIDATHLAAWLRTTARLRAMNVLRKLQNRQQSLNDSVLNSLDAVWEQHDATPASALADALNDCVQTLGEKARKLLQSRYADGLSVGQIARSINRPVNSLYVSLSRIHSALADCVFRRTSAPNRGSDA